MTPLGKTTVTIAWPRSQILGDKWTKLGHGKGFIEHLWLQKMEIHSLRQVSNTLLEQTVGVTAKRSLCCSLMTFLVSELFYVSVHADISK